MFTIINGSKRLTVKDHRPLIEYLDERGIDTSTIDISYFIWNALPEPSEGTFLIWEKEWIDLKFDGSATVDLEIKDEEATVLFKNLKLRDVTFIQSDNVKVLDIDGKEGRLLLVRLELDRYVNTPLQQDTQGLIADEVSMENLRDNFDNFYPDSTILPFDVTPLSDRPVFHTFEQHWDVYAAYVAHIHFLTAYYPKIGSVTTLPTISNVLSDILYADDALIHNRVTVNSTGISFQFIFRDHLYRCKDYNTDAAFETAIQTSSLFGATPDPYFYLSTPAEQVPAVNRLKFYYPFHIVDPNTSYQSFLDAIGVIALLNAITRFQRNIFLQYAKVVDEELSNDIQRITYRFNDLGMTTTLETIPWKPWNPYNLPDPRITITDVVRIISEEKDEDGFMDGEIQRYDVATLTWINVGPCKVLDANAQ